MTDKEKYILKFDTVDRFLKAGTILIPKPEWKEYYDRIKWYQHEVTEEDEKQHATIGDNWMIAP